MSATFSNFVGVNQQDEYMEKIKSVMLWLLAVIMFVSCAASRKAEQGSSEQQCDSVVAIVKDSVVKSETSMDSTNSAATTEQLTTGTMTDKGSNEETIQERVTESTDVQGNKTTTTDRTIHRKSDYERSSTYEQRLERQERQMARMQHVIDSIKLSNSRDVGTHWEMKDSVNVVKDRNTKDIKAETTWNDFVNILKDMCFGIISLWIFLNFLLWVREKTRKWLK